jgi:hypothetical protein
VYFMVELSWLEMYSEMLVANYFPKMMAKATAYAAQSSNRRALGAAQEQSLLD